MRSQKFSDYLFIVFLLFAGIGLLSGLFAGMVRLGWTFEGGAPVSKGGRIANIAYCLLSTMILIFGWVCGMKPLMNYLRENEQNM